MKRLAQIAVLMMVFCWLIATECAVSASLSTTLNLNYVSETLSPGNSANLQGGGFTATTGVQLCAIDASGHRINPVISPTLISRSANLIQIQIPSNYTPGLWAVWLIDDSGNTSVTRYINQAQGVRFNSDAAAPGGTVEVWGRNLGGYAGASSMLAFVGPDNTPYLATVLSADANHLVATVPAALTPGAGYRVYISNGLGGISGYTLISAPLSIRTPGIDPLTLGVPWAADLTYLSANYLTAPNCYNVRTDARLTLHAVGDGVHDDAKAIQSAINLASVNGGVVYLPTGTYWLGTPQVGSMCLAIKSHVALIGDGMQQTVIQGGKPNSSTPGLVTFSGATLSGIANLTLQNLNTSGRSNITISAVGNPNTKEVFLQNIDCQGANGTALNFDSVSYLLIANSTIVSTATKTGSLSMLNSSFPVLQNNAFYYQVGRLILGGTRYALLLNNTFNRNGLYAMPGTPGSGGPEISNATAPVLSGNQFVVSAGAVGGNNDGETILTQDALSSTYFRDSGTVSSASGLTLVDSTKSWPLITPFPTAEIITINSGPAMGQWRYVTALSVDSTFTVNTMTIDRPWDFIPPSGSQYSLGGWSADRVFVLNNTFIDSIKPSVELYNGAWYSTISGNTITNDLNCSTNPLDHGGILLRSVDQSLTSNKYWLPSQILHCVCWEDQVFNNTILNYALKTMFFQLEFSEVSGGLHGNGALNTEFRNNLLNSQAVDTNGQYILDRNSGYLGSAQSVNGTGSLPGSGVILGAIFEGNQAVNVPTVYQMATALLQTITD